MAQDDGMKKLGELIKGQKVAMLTTIEKDGSLRSRPMWTQQIEFDGDLWFFTSKTSEKAQEVQNEGHVNLSYTDAAREHYVSISGRAFLIHDKAKEKELWNPLYKAWFPKGLEDPDIALLKISVEKAEYWDAPSGKMIQFLGMLRTAITGAPFPADHGTIRLQH